MRLYSICCKKGNKYGILDSADGVVEYYTERQISIIVNKYKLNVMGYNNGKISIFRGSNFSDVIDRFFTLMRKESYYSDEQRNDEEGYAAVRDWGSWHVPEDAYDEYDEDEISDWDWEELDRDWFKKLRKVGNELKTRYPDLQVTIHTSEKNWIDLKLERLN